MSGWKQTAQIIQGHTRTARNLSLAMCRYGILLIFKPTKCYEVSLSSYSLCACISFLHYFSVLKFKLRNCIQYSLLRYTFQKFKLFCSFCSVYRRTYTGIRSSSYIYWKNNSFVKRIYLDDIDIHHHNGLSDHSTHTILHS